MHAPDQTKIKEEVLEGSSTVAELVYTLVVQGENTKTLTSEFLIKSISCIQLSLVDHLRVFNGLQQVVFEPGGSLCALRRSNKILDQIVWVKSF